MVVVVLRPLHSGMVPTGGEAMDAVEGEDREEELTRSELSSPHRIRRGQVTVRMPTAGSSEMAGKERLRALVDKASGVGLRDMASVAPGDAHGSTMATDFGWIHRVEVASMAPGP